MTLQFKRYFTQGNEYPLDIVEWEKRDAVIRGKNGEVVFDAKNVEFPSFWSQQATNIVASKYFRMVNGERETSVRDMIFRVANTIAAWGIRDEYFDQKNGTAFQDELMHILVHQYASFNSPVWFNVGVQEKPQTSACFLLAVEDDMESILDWYKEEGMIFKGGSGAGINLSKLRAKGAPLSGGGKASGPVSFMRAADANAGAIKSGGTTRRAAKMVILNVDHPDIMEFIRCKVVEEEKAKALIAAGYDAGLEGEAFSTVAFQNANNSVGVTDDFMTAASLHKLTTLHGDIVEAELILNAIAEAAHATGCPGLQFTDTINRWHTCPHSGPITTSNPCCLVGTSLIDTSEGLVSFADLYAAAQEGKSLPFVFGHDISTNMPVLRPIKSVWIAGEAQKLVEVETNKGIKIQCTPEHKFLLRNGTYVQAKHLRVGDRLRIANSMTRDGRIQGMTWEEFTEKIEEHRCLVNDIVAAVTELICDVPETVYDMEVEGTHNFAVNSGELHSVVVHNSEHVFLDNSACNLASINLLKFMRDDGQFNIAAFKHVVDVLITAQDILIDRSNYPTEKIANVAKSFRPLGLGYANLGALLMARGIPYDSDAGRDYAAAITALMTGEAYLHSARLARVKGAFEGHEVNRQAMHKVIMAHHAATFDLLKSGHISHALAIAGAEAINAAQASALAVGYRNAQVTLLAPTGTIAFMMDCDTTGIEPCLGLVTTKKLVGGGEIRMVNNAVKAYFDHAYIKDKDAAYLASYVQDVGAFPKEFADFNLNAAVFQCALGDNALSWQAHVKMVAAVQPFLSGAVSKTINMPAESTVEDIKEAYMMAWQLGLKSLAVYRDGSKGVQPVTVKQDVNAYRLDEGTWERPIPVVHDRMMAPVVPVVPDRKRLPDERAAISHKFSVGGQEGYLHVGLYEDGQPGELFVTMSKEGSTISGLMDAFASIMSISLQYGVPLRVLVGKLRHTRYEPHGFTTSKEIRTASSITDYVAQWLERKFLVGLNLLSAECLNITEEKVGMPQAHGGPYCQQCGGATMQNGTCYVCVDCGESTGC
jgi:ribonucleotide reductase alpha subunit